MIEHDELADYSSLRRELRTIYGEGAPRKGESWPAYYLRLIADDRAAAEASVVSLKEALREAEWKLRESKPHRDTLLPCNSEFVMGIVADDLRAALASEGDPMRYGQGLPPAGGWKLAMAEDPTEYSPEFQDEYRRLWHAAEASVVSLTEALRHYDDEDHWTDVTPGPENNTAGYLAFEYDGGHELPWSVARAALASSEGEADACDPASCPEDSCAKYGCMKVWKARLVASSEEGDEA